MSEGLLVFLALQSGKDMEGAMMFLPALVRCKSFEIRIRRSQRAESSTGVCSRFPGLQQGEPAGAQRTMWKHLHFQAQDEPLLYGESP